MAENSTRTTHRVRRCLAVLATSLVALAGGVLSAPPAAAAQQFPIAYSKIGVYPHSAPTMSPDKRSGAAVADGTMINVVCETEGEPVNNGVATISIWMKTDSGEYFPNAFVYTGYDGRTPGIPDCSEMVEDLALESTTINGVNVGTPKNARHKWGDCTVQDFDGGPHGWLIVDYTHGTNIVRNGMLEGWKDKGGGPGFGCATESETSYKGGARQAFDKGTLYWFKGMGPAESPVEFDGVYIPKGEALATLLFTYYYSRKGGQVVLDWSYIESDPALIKALRGLEVGAEWGYFQADPTREDSLYYALGTFGIKRTSSHCYKIYDEYNFNPDKPTNIPYLRQWLDAREGKAAEFAVNASGCLPD